MRNLIFYLMLLIFLIPACKENPVDIEDNKAFSIEWKPVYKNTQLGSLSGDKNGLYQTLALIDLTKCTVAKIKINYYTVLENSSYNILPRLYVGGGTGICLYSKNYMKLDTLLKCGSISGLSAFSIYLLNSKVYYDTIIILKN